MSALTGGNFNGDNFTLLTTSNPAQVLAASFNGGRMRGFTDRITMESQAKSKTIAMAVMPNSAVPILGVLFNSASVGTAVISVGITGTTAKYRALLVKTSLVPEIFGVATGIGVQLTALEEVLIVNDATATLAAAGILGMTMQYMTDA